MPDFDGKWVTFLKMSHIVPIKTKWTPKIL